MNDEEKIMMAGFAEAMEKDAFNWAAAGKGLQKGVKKGLGKIKDLFSKSKASGGASNIPAGQKKLPVGGPPEHLNTINTKSFGRKTVDAIKDNPLKATAAAGAAGYGLGEWD